MIGSCVGSTTRKAAWKASNRDPRTRQKMKWKMKWKNKRKSETKNQKSWPKPNTSPWPHQSSTTSPTSTRPSQCPASSPPIPAAPSTWSHLTSRATAKSKANPNGTGTGRVPSKSQILTWMPSGPWTPPTTTHFSLSWTACSFPLCSGTHIRTFWCTSKSPFDLVGHTHSGPDKLFFDPSRSSSSWSCIWMEISWPAHYSIDGQKCSCARAVRLLGIGFC